MRIILLLAVACLIFDSCKPTIKKQDQKAKEEKTARPFNKRFFDYDEIDYYFNDYDEMQIDKLYDNQSKSAIDSLKMGVILGDIPTSITDLSFIDKLGQTGYKRTPVPESKFAAIDQIFIEKPVKENMTTSCIYVYRDILIFKKKHKVIGTAKVCFGCMAHQIQGSDANTNNFGQDGDYRKLGDLLRN